MIYCDNAATTPLNKDVLEYYYNMPDVGDKRKRKRTKKKIQYKSYDYF